MHESMQNNFSVCVTAAGLVQYEEIGVLSIHWMGFEFRLLPPTYSSTNTDYIKHVWGKSESVACPDWNRGVNNESLESLSTSELSED